jgi:mannose-1-phosphate guanylyltransferase/phosphomannomutase
MIALDRAESEARVAEAVRGSGADLGAVIDAGGERLTLIDERGEVLTDDEAIVAFLDLVSGDGAGDAARVALPVTASDQALALCAARGIEVTLTPLSTPALLGAAADGVSFAADRRGGYVFPSFLPAFDAAAALVRLVSLLGAGKVSLAEVVRTTPPMPVLHEEVPTPFEQKGLLMRTLMEELADEGADLVLVDGIKMRTAEGWVLVVPDPEEPVTHVWAEGRDLPGSERLAADQVARLGRMLASA